MTEETYSYCTNCGSRNPITNIFCAACGQVLYKGEAKPLRMPTGPPPSPLPERPSDRSIDRRQIREQEPSFALPPAKPRQIGRSSKKIAAAVVVIVVAVVLGMVGLWFNQQVRQREALRTVQISFDGVGVRSIGLTGASLDIRLRMYNPNTITATLDRANYDLYGNNNHLGNGVIPQRIDIPAGSSRTVTTDFSLSYGGGAPVIWSALREGRVSWRIRGTAYFDTPLGTISVPFDVTL